VKILFKKEYGQLIPYSLDDKQALENMPDDTVYSVDIKSQDLRTMQQNKALHKWFTMVADALNDRHLPIVKVLKVDVLWSADSVKELLWRKVQEAVVHKKSTAKLEKKELDKVYDTLNSALAIKFGISIPFPSREAHFFDTELSQKSV
jgi:hypothetical protein